MDDLAIVPRPGDLLEVTPRGLFCPAGGFYVDPLVPVERAVVTHAHADHARPGSKRYLAARAGERVLRRRLGAQARIETVAYGEAVSLNGVRVSLHPAGHILGSAQVRIEHRGAVWVVSGDYKLAPDPTCAAFEAVPCQVFVSESTFGRPEFRWRPSSEVSQEVLAWWQANREAGRASLLFAYALGKAQRLLAELEAASGGLAALGPVFTHRVVADLCRDYRASGVALPGSQRVQDRGPGASWERALIMAPPAASGTAWVHRFRPAATALASGWLGAADAAGRRGLGRGFALSDHADWPGLQAAITATGAERIWLDHGDAPELAHALRAVGKEVGLVGGWPAGGQAKAG